MGEDPEIRRSLRRSREAALPPRQPRDNIGGWATRGGGQSITRGQRLWTSRGLRATVNALKIAKWSSCCGTMRWISGVWGTGTQVRSPALHSGLWTQHCHSFSVSQLQLGSDHWPGNYSTCCVAAQKRKKWQVTKERVSSLAPRTSRPHDRLSYQLDHLMNGGPKWGLRGAGVLPRKPSTALGCPQGPAVSPALSSLPAAQRTPKPRAPRAPPSPPPPRTEPLTSFSLCSTMTLCPWLFLHQMGT